MFSIRKNLTAGLLAAVPLWVTWLVVAFILGLAVDLAGPVTRWLVGLFRPVFPAVADALASKTAQHSLSVLLLLLILYWLGWLTTHVVGRRLLGLLDKILQRLPFVGKVYGGTKHVIEAFQVKPEKSTQVVLIEYPHPGMKTIGLVTKSMTDARTQRPLLAVYVPTTPNPTSGFLEIVPAEDVVPTDWSVNDAITFVVSGGSVGPSAVVFDTTGAVPGETTKDR